MVPFGERIMNDFGPHMGQYWMGPLAALLILGVLVAGAIIITRMLINRPHQQSGAGPAVSPRPIQILEERFARGEIDEEEFRSRRDALRT
jgi:putative membrane protein